MQSLWVHHMNEDSGELRGATGNGAEIAFASYLSSLLAVVHMELEAYQRWRYQWLNNRQRHGIPKIRKSPTRKRTPNEPPNNRGRDININDVVLLTDKRLQTFFC